MPREYCKVDRCKKWANLNDDKLCPHHVILLNKDSCVQLCISV